jgi:DNA primase
MIPKDVVQRVVEASRLSEVVGRRIKLRKAGRAWQGLCCFHEERTPSLNVDDQRGTWKCFGCGEGGNVIDFVRLSYGWTFIEAIEALARDVGITISPLSPERIKAEARKLGDLEVIDLARLWYSQQLERTPEARAYLKQRGVSDEAVQAFGIGFAPAADSRGLAAAVGGRSGDDVLSRTGLVLADTGAPYFRDRIIFPIRDLRGRTVSFAGRALADAKPKYLTGRSSEIFVKTDVLYGADLARQPAHDGKPLAVVEGYLDVIAFWQAGIPAVAIMGSDLSEAQLRQLWRLSDRPILCFDGDTAGRAATRKALTLAFRHIAPGTTLQVAQMPSGRDPGSYLASGALAQLSAVLSAPVGLADAFWSASIADGLPSTPGQRAGLEQSMVDIIKGVGNGQLREKYIADCRQRIKQLAQPRAVYRANGDTYHSTNPATRRLLHGMPPVGRMTLREAISIVEVAQDPTIAVEMAGRIEEARLILASCGLDDGGQKASITGQRATEDRQGNSHR